MREILLTQGKIAIVDDEDFEYLSQWKWYPEKGAYTYYAVRPVYKGISVRMHREILKCPRGKQVDHENGDGLDNRKSNIRICTKRQNAFNQKLRANNTSGYRGVSWFKRDSNWRVQVKLNGKTKTIGYFDNIRDAAKCYDAWAKKYYGKFANLNFMKDHL